MPAPGTVGVGTGRTLPTDPPNPATQGDGILQVVMAQGIGLNPIPSIHATCDGATPRTPR